MVVLSKYDFRQIILMNKKIALYEQKKIDLFNFFTSLDGLLNALETVSNSWKDSFQAEVNSLEMINDSLEDGSILKWKGNFEEDLQKSVSKLKKLTTFLLEEYLKAPDPNKSSPLILKLL